MHETNRIFEEMPLPHFCFKVYSVHLLIKLISYPFKLFWLHYIAQCAEDGLCALCGFCISRKGGTGGGGWGHMQGAVHMVAARFGCEGAMVGSGWGTSRPECMNRLRKHYSHLVEGWCVKGMYNAESRLK